MGPTRPPVRRVGRLASRAQVLCAVELRPLPRVSRDAGGPPPLRWRWRYTFPAPRSPRHDNVAFCVPVLARGCGAGRRARCRCVAERSSAWKARVLHARAWKLTKSTSAVHFLTCTYCCSERGGTSPGTSSTLAPSAMAAVVEWVAAQSLRPLCVTVGKKWVGGDSQRLAGETLADGATPWRLPQVEVCTSPTANTVAETSAGDGHHQKSGEGGEDGGRWRKGLHWA